MYPFLDAVEGGSFLRKDPLSRIGFWTHILRNRCNSANSALERQPLQVLAELRSEVGALEREFNCSLQHPELVSGVVAFALKRVAEDLFLFEQCFDAIR